MAHKGLVTIGTDGLSDWVRTSDGVKYMLGPISVLKFVTELSPGSRAARQAVDRFLRKGQSMLTVDLDLMWALLAPHKPRYSFVSPLIPASDRTPFARQGTTMADADQFIKDSISNQVARIEQQIGVIQQHAKEASPGSISANMMKGEMDRLRDLVAWLRRPSAYGNQSDNSTYYGLPGGTPGGVKNASDAAAPAASAVAAPPAAAPAAVAPPAAPATDTLAENTKLASHVLRRVAATEERIDQLVLAGKRFDVGRAKGDLLTIATRVSEIGKSVDLSQPWVRNDLVDLARRADHVHGLFASAKV